MDDRIRITPYRSVISARLTLRHPSGPARMKHVAAIHYLISSGLTGPVPLLQELSGKSDGARDRRTAPARVGRRDEFHRRYCEAHGRQHAIAMDGFSHQ